MNRNNKQITVGIAGHIDHGKTSFVKALTGIDTDSLKEEKQRGITINIGFASLPINNQHKVGIIDVPGHEKFIKNMLAGASGIDFLVLVVAADEGVMPQTREHFIISSLLGIKRGLILLTKIDLVENDFLELVINDIKKFTKNTFLEDSPIIKFSIKDPQKGKAEFIKTIQNMVSKIEAKSSIFRLPVDRVFNVKGFGKVVTGTILGGTIKKGDIVSVSGNEKKFKARGLEVYNKKETQAYEGERCAINIQGLEKESIKRGDVLSFPDTLKKSRIIDTHFTYLESNKNPLKNHSNIKFYIGTKEINAKIHFYNKKELNKGGSYFVQFIFNEDIVSIRNDRFIVRSLSPVKTIGGGKILNPISKKYKKDDNIESIAKTLQGKDDTKLCLSFIENSKMLPIDFNTLKIMTNFNSEKLLLILSDLKKEKSIFEIGKMSFIYCKSFNKVKNLTNNIIKTYHNENSFKQGMPLEELKNKLPIYVQNNYFNEVINDMEDDIVVEKGLIKAKKYKVVLKDSDKNLKEKILKIYQDNKLSPPTIKELSEKLSVTIDKVKNILNLCREEKTLIKVSEELFFYKTEIDSLKEKLINFLLQNEKIFIADFKNMTKISRKYLIPLLEYFDNKKITIRTENFRKLWKQKT